MEKEVMAKARLSMNGLAKASNGFTPDFSAQELSIGREFTSKHGSEMVELVGSADSFIVLAGSLGKLAKDYSSSVLNKDGKPAKVGERYYLSGKIGSSDGILFAVA